MNDEEWLKSLDEYKRKLSERLVKGRAEYGDGSFERTELDLIGELQDECLDLAGWGFVLWTKLEKIKERL